MKRLATRIIVFGRMIRFSHSLFALPFAFSAAALAAREDGLGWRQVLWIVVAMVGARSAAMGFNRLADQEIDARNPRTATRELPAGRLSRDEVWLFVCVSSLVLVGAAAMLNPLCLALSPAALAVIFAYSYTKRFTALSHVVLGLALGIAPVGAWIAVTGSFALAPMVLGLAVLLWVAGFDTIYACQDVDFDRAEGLHSLPVLLGVSRALLAARVFHAACLALLGSLYFLAPLHPVYLVGVAAVGMLLLYEHSLVSPDDLSRVNAAFFTVNGWVSLGYMATTVAAVALP